MLEKMERPLIPVRDKHSWAGVASPRAAHTPLLSTEYLGALPSVSDLKEGRKDSTK